jgi:hypothetical protein
VDYARTIDPVLPGKSNHARVDLVDFYQSVIHALWVNNAKNRSMI